jgi:hypothetical protein
MSLVNLFTKDLSESVLLPFHEILNPSSHQKIILKKAEEISNDPPPNVCMFNNIQTNNVFDNISKTIHDNQQPVDNQNNKKPEVVIINEPIKNNNSKLDQLINRKLSEVVVAPRVVEAPRVVKAPRVVEVQVENIEKVQKLENDIDKLRELNMKYLQVINEVNEELLKIKTETPRKINVLEDENNKLSQKVVELSNALVNAINQNKTLSRALALKSIR